MATSQEIRLEPSGLYWGGAFSPDVSGSGDFTVRIWDTLSRAERARLARRR